MENWHHCYLTCMGESTSLLCIVWRHWCSWGNNGGKYWLWICHTSAYYRNQWLLLVGLQCVWSHHVRDERGRHQQESRAAKWNKYITEALEDQWSLFAVQQSKSHVSKNCLLTNVVSVRIQPLLSPGVSFGLQEGLEIRSGPSIHCDSTCDWLIHLPLSTPRHAISAFGLSLEGRTNHPTPSSTDQTTAAWLDTSEGQLTLALLKQTSQKTMQ